jgi:photosystem II stability/assembly factor-like uncharacterized protein
VAAATTANPFTDLGDGLIYTSLDAGATWKPTSAPASNWSFVASSADGTQLVAVSGRLWVPTNYVAEGAIYRSSNSGLSWEQTSAPHTIWNAVACSADGTRLIAVSGLYDTGGYSVAGDGGIYSSLDSGATWQRTSAPTMDWSCVAASADGNKWFAAATGQGESEPYLIYTSTDLGATWLPIRGPSDSYRSLASSADGLRLAAGGVKGIYTSTDSGLTWTADRGPGFGLTSSADGYRLAAANYGALLIWPYSGPWKLASAPTNDWESVACSADGTKLIAVGLPPPFRGDTELIYRSADSGATWTQTSAPAGAWTCLAASADGSRVVAAGSTLSGTNSAIYRSSDAGATWNQTSAPINNWGSIASSADGVNLVAAASLAFTGSSNEARDGTIYRSADAGATWNQTSAPTNRWTSIASSMDGTKLVVASESIWDYTANKLVAQGAIYRSSDGGASWTATSAPNANWIGVASSADGTKLVAAAAPLLLDVELGTFFGQGAVFRSTDAGATWVKTSAPNGYWSAVASSADGKFLMAGSLSLEPGLLISTNSGVSWAAPVMPGPGSWHTWSNFGKNLACSADGTFFVAVGNAHIATLRAEAPTTTPPPPPSPRLAIGMSDGRVVVSWTAPSTPFVLEQSSDLRSDDWAPVTTSPNLNLNNLHYELPLAPSSAQGFYRLIQR